VSRRSERPGRGRYPRRGAGAYQAKPARVFGFEEIAEAHEVMEAGQAGGKLVVTGA
jgi:NADPH:quinone reductase-like Zn-dependent oxidoreductase